MATKPYDAKPPTSRTLRDRIRAAPLWAFIGGLIVLAGVSFFLGTVSSTATAQPIIDRTYANLVQTEASLQQALDNNMALEERVAEEKSRANAAVTKSADAQRNVEEREKAVAEAEAAVTARESAVGTAEQQQAASEIKNGVHVVGTTVQPGVYSTDGPNGTNSAGCYYAWKSGTGSDADIVDNNIVSGVATVTLNAGEVFESKACKPWTKVG